MSHKYEPAQYELPLLLPFLAVEYLQFGLASLILSVASPLLGLISFKRLGLINKFPEQWHSTLKWAHRRVRRRRRRRGSPQV